MTNADQFPTDQNRIIQALERRIADLEAQVRQSKGTPILRASGPFFLPDWGTPATPAGGAAIYASGGRLRYVTSSGQVRQVPGRGSAVSDLAPQVATPLPGGATVTANDYNKLGFDVDQVWDAMNALLPSLRNADVIAT